MMARRCRHLAALLMDATVLLGVAWPRAGADYLDLTYTINYTGTAPKGAKLRVTGHAASPGFLGLTVPVNYDQEFDISGLTAAQARNLILNSKANPIGLTPFGSDAAVNAAGTGIDITTLDDARGNARTVDRIDLTPKKAAKGLAANGAISIAAVQSRNDNSLGTASNGWTVALGAGIDSGGATGGESAVHDEWHARECPDNQRRGAGGRHHIAGQRLDDGRI